MSSEGIQITIPDLDEEDLSSTPIPFGRAGAFGFGGSSNSGPESPTILTPTTTDKGFFGTHNRGDSLASNDSFLDHIPRKPFAHVPQPSIAASTISGTTTISSTTGAAASTSASPFSKKPSFASIRNAFKSSSKNNADVPPLPSIDGQVYPILKNPFNRSTSSLAHSITSTSKHNTTSPPHVHPRPPTPAGESRYPRSLSRARGHSKARSHHSQSGSIFHNSDNGSDHGHSSGHHPPNHAFTFGHPPASPPPVPRVPDGLLATRGDSPAMSDDDFSVGISGGKSPSDYALHAVFIRFATLAEAKIDAFLHESLNTDPALTDYFAPSLDPQFDDLLRSLAKIAQRHAKNVVEAITRWRRGIGDLSGAGGASSTRSRTAEHRSLAVIYIMCRALISVLSSLPPQALGDTLGYSLEETIFDQFKSPAATSNTNYRSCTELYAVVLGCLARIRFVSVTDRFLNELAPVAGGQVAKDSDTKFENLVKGLRHVQLKVWPPEAFEEGAEFMESLAKSFENAHGLRFKIAFAETIVRLLHPIGKTAQAEVNHPLWGKAIERIYPRAREMMGKPRYWQAAYPLAVTTLCVAPHQFFLKAWTACFEYGIGKLKDKPSRIPIMNGVVRLIWTYLFRCQESASTSTAKLDTLLKQLFPQGRALVYPNEEHLEPFICVIHFVLSKYFDFGRDFCMDLLQESSGVLVPERVAVAVQATLLTLHAVEREDPTPTWPSSSDFSAVPSWDDYPSSSDTLPSALLSKPGVQDFCERFGAAISAIAQSCFKAVGRMSVFDEQWALSRLSSTSGGTSFEESHNVVIRRHPEGAVAYPSQLVSQMSILQSCFQSWPRCLHTPSLSLPDAVDMLVRGVIHVEPRVGEAAGAALRRLMKDARHGLTVLKCFTTLLFDPRSLEREVAGIRMVLESTRLLNLWTSIVDSWISGLTHGKKLDAIGNDLQTIATQARDIAAGALFLLSYELSSIRCIGVKLVRSLQSLFATLALSDPSLVSTQFSTLFQHNVHNNLQGFDELLDRAEFDRLQQWKKSGKPDVLLRIADSNNDKDRRIWRHIYPSFMRSSQSLAPHLVSDCRAIVEAAVSRYHSTMLHLAGISGSAIRSQSSRASEKDGHKLIKENMQLIDQWHVWIKILSSTVTVSEGRLAMVHAGREHSRVPSDVGFERERTSTSRNLFRHLTPFLDSDYAPFRDAAVLSISSFPPEAYSQLLEDLNSFARQFYDEIRPKNGSSGWTGRSRRQSRLHSAVARIYYLTAPHLQHPNLTAKQDALSHALKFVRNTQAFLVVPENRENYAHQRLRRYFCGLVERLFDALAGLPDSDRFTPPNIHITLYRLVEGWCQYGPQSESVKQRFILMQRAAVAANNDPQMEVAERFQNETKLLSNATIGALAALCQKACLPQDAMESTSPTERPPQDLRTPDPGQLVERLHAVFETDHIHLRASARKALKSLLTLPQLSSTFLSDVMRRSFCDPTTSSLTATAFFEVVADVVCDTPDHPFTFPQIVTLGTANLCHNDISIRRRAFDILVATHERASGVIAMAEFETMIVNPAPSVYLQTHRLIAECMAGEHPAQAHDVLAEVSALLLRIHHGGGGRVSHLMLQSLEHWVPHLHVQDEDPHSLHLTTDGSFAVYHLLTLTKRYSDAEPEQIGAIWASLVEVPDPRCGRAVASFLVNESSKVATRSFVKCASEVIACLSRSAVGVQIFEELCSICEPERMLPTLDHRLRHLAPAEVELWSDLDVLFADDQPRYFLGSAQYAMLFIGSTALERLWTYGNEISAILLAVLSHIDHRVPMLRAAARRMLFQLTRSCIPWYPPATDKVGAPNRTALLSVVSAMEGRGDSLFWTDEDPIDVVNTRMEYVVDQILSVIGLFVPDLASQLGKVAIEYLDHCVIRSIAMRCLQVYRCLKLPLTQAVLGHILVRFTTMAGDQDSELHPVNAEIITAITASVVAGNYEPALLPKIFWTAAACLMTVVEREFVEAVKLLISVLSRLDLEDADVVGSLLFQQPESWNASSGLQTYLLGGMRSAVTMQDTFTALLQLTRVSDSRLVEPSERRLCELFTLSLPWCLRAMVSDNRDAALDEFCTCIARLAEQEGRDSITRVMTSLVKNRFRTKDDFLRQSAATLREHYAAHWTNVSTLLLGLVLNKENWVRVHTMQVLKVFFEQRDLRNASHCLTTEHLMPLLRLVEGDLAAQALDVLEEPNKVHGGPNARQVLRMSMHGALNHGTVDDGEIFGVPEESGWSIPHVDTRRTEYRHNLYAVAQTCIGSWRPSLIRLESRGNIVSFTDGLDEDLGVLVQDLHDLSEFFQNNRSQQQVLLPSQQLEERVASIIARSTGDSDDAPHTPFADAFQIGNLHYFSDDSADDSGSESELDAFVFDSPAYHREGPNGTHLG